MGVLDIVHGIGGGLFHGQIQIEIELGVGLPQVEIEPRRVNGNLFEERDQGDGLARALGGLDHLAVPDEPHHLHEHYLQAGRIHTEGLQGRLQAGHIAVVVRPEHVKGQIEPPGDQFIVMVGDIGHHISQ